MGAAQEADDQRGQAHAQDQADQAADHRHCGALTQEEADHLATGQAGRFDARPGAINHAGVGCHSAWTKAP